MKSIGFSLTLLTLVSLAASPAAAKDDPLEFLHRMQKDGFADIAIEYLNDLKSDPNAPPEIMQLWDLEMSQSMREQVKSAYNADEAKQLKEKSKALMDKFLKNNPNVPEALKAAAEYSSEEAIQAQYEVLRAQAMTDKAEKAKTLAAARATFQNIRQRFEKARDAAAQYRAKVANLPRLSPNAKEAAFIQVGESRLRLAMVEFYLGLTEGTTAQRDAKFAKVAKEFESIYQEYGDYFVGWEAHYWNARILQEQGRNRDARDYYEEVQAHDATDVPDAAAGDRQTRVQRASIGKGPELEDYFFSDVERQFLMVLFTVSKSDYYKEVLDWRKTHTAAREKCPEFQGLTLDYARHLIEASAAAKDEKKKSDNKRLEALRLLTDMTKVPSPYQRDAAEVLRQLRPKAVSADSFDFLIIDADSAVRKKDWAAAAELYGKALAAATPKTDRKQVAEARNAYVGCIHNEAMSLYNKKKVDDAVELIKKMLVVPEYRATAAAPAAALFALNIQYYQLLELASGAEEKSKATNEIEAKVVAFAKSIIGVHEWTAKEEADSARIILLRVAIMKCDAAEAKWRAANQKAAEAKDAAAKAKSGSDEAKTVAANAKSAAEAAAAAEGQAKTELAEADGIFKGISKSSHKYPEALTILGWKHWQKYRVAKRAWDNQNDRTPPNKATQNQWDDDRKQAFDYTKNAADLLSAEHAKGAPMSKELRDTKTLLAEIYSDGDAKRAVGVYKELVDDILADPSTKSLDDSTLRVFNGAVQAYLQLNDMSSASAVATKLLDFGADELPVNLAIVNFAKRLELARKQAATDLDAANNPSAGQQALLDLETKFMINLAQRENLAPATKVWIVQVLSKLGNDNADAVAAQLARKLLDLALNDNNIHKQIEKAEPGLHTLAANILARQGNYEKAADEVKTLVDQFPRALAPQMSRAQILTLWAAQDPSKYGEAISAWHTLAGKLERVKIKKVGTDGKPLEEKMPEYYEAFYNECLCFYKMADKTKDKSLAKKAFDLMTPALSFDPKLQGPAHDRELTFKFYQLAGKLADYLGEPRPVMPKK